MLLQIPGGSIEICPNLRANIDYLCMSSIVIQQPKNTKMKKTFYIFVLLVFTFSINAQVSKIFESFESTTFPPAGWQRISVAGPVQWVRTVAPLTATFGGPTNVPKHGTAVAFINYDASGGNDWLISSKVSGIVSGDSLVFWLIKQFSDGPWIPDSLIIKVSTTDSLIGSFTNTPQDLHSLPAGWHKSDNLEKIYRSLNPLCRAEYLSRFPAHQC
jgi:hypothetical protein